MPKSALTKIVACAFSAIALSAGFITSVFAGPVSLSDNSKEKMIQPVAPLCEPRWYVSAGLGIDIDTQATDFVQGTKFDPFGDDNSGGFIFQDYKGHSWGEIYDNSIYHGELQAGYVLTDHIELFATGRYEGGYGRKTYGDSDALNYNLYGYGYVERHPLAAYPGLYRSWGGELGLRYFFFSKDTDVRPFRTIRPYISISGGAAHVDHIGDVVYSDFNTRYSYRPFIKGQLYDESIIGTGALLIGAEMPLSCHWSLGLEAGVRYHSQLDGSNDITRYKYYFNCNQTESCTPSHVDNRHYNDAGDRLDVPVTGYIKYRFGGGDSGGSVGLLSSAGPISLGYDSKDSKEKMIQPMAPECDPRWYVSAGLGIDIDTQATDFVQGTKFNPYGDDAYGGYYIEDYKGHSWGEIYDNSIYQVELQAGYVLTNHIELFATGRYEGGYGSKTYGDRSTGDYGYYGNGLVAYPGLYRSWGGELGLRYFFFDKETDIRLFRTIRPYVSLSGGAAHVDHIGDVVYSDYLSRYYYKPFIKGHLYDESVIGTGALLIGAEVPLTCHWSLGLEAGVRYHSQLDGSNDITRYQPYYYYTESSTPYHVDNRHYNDAGDRLDVPVNGYIKFRF